MIPIISLIGRSNVGKSSLFNLLTKTNSSLINNKEKTTRDRNYGFFVIKKKNFCIIDTAGIDFFKKKEKKNFLKIESYNQTKFAIKESNFVIFMVDAKEGIQELDFYILKKIRKENKSIILVINKIDKISNKEKIIDFYRFGIKKIYKISVSHKKGLSNLLKEIYISSKKIIKEKEIKTVLSNKLNYLIKIRICFIGKPNVGKSSLINSLVNYNRMITSSIPGTTRDIIKVSLNNKNIEYIFTDTAGIKKKNKRKTILEKVSEKRSINVIKKNNISIVVIDANTEIYDQDLSIINLVIKSKCTFFIVVNKWDLILKSKKNEIKKNINSRLQFIKNIKIIYISALYKTGLKKFIHHINLVYQESLKTFSSSCLTSILNKAIIQHPLPTGVTGKAIRLKYAHLGKKNPLFIIIHGTQTQYVSRTYKKYLMHFFQKELQIPNTPIQLFFKKSINPYIKLIN
ncbi:ribosome biogenesis GTPase Der [Buchnera aphidicola]|uniref:GTPase Der n=1 Tax=Buchnera aphidicola (Cinara curvipes) TaxID=2518975 RepID=A0A451D7K3_9GAMM|nr:ribosome biogenesis GTPase Der [Buchnera aphidicola]VFP81674.1 GTPase Der [Buchnera aphidicola (Cinara curvipes)]